jgi:Cu+-exporting ATPase
MAKINSIIFDKTGTITSNASAEATYEGMPLNEDESNLLRSSLRNSNHPLSRSLYNLLQSEDIITLDDYREDIGKGISAKHANNEIKIGSASYVGSEDTSVLNTTVHVSSNNTYKGKFTFYNQYRKGLSKLFNQLKSKFDLTILSGDNEGERENLQKLLPPKTKLLFNQKPDDKLQYIAYHQSEGQTIAMIGDGLNDAGALAQSDVGIAISENVNVFSPACDAILDASKFNQLHSYFNMSQQAVKIIKWAFVLSFMYNAVGLYFAVTGQLSPVIAAILMPLSSISIVAFTTVCTNIVGKKLKTDAIKSI